MWIPFGDIRDQTRKLSKIAQNFGRFFGSPKFFGVGLPKNVPSLSLLPRGTSTDKVHEDTPTSPEVIESNTLNFRPNFKFSPLNFWGDPRPPYGCALASLGQSVARVEI